MRTHTNPFRKVFARLCGYAHTHSGKFSPAFFKRRCGQGRIALVALRRERNAPCGVSFCKAFSLAFCFKEKALKDFREASRPYLSVGTRGVCGCCLSRTIPPSAFGSHRLAAARSHSGSDNTLCCHSLPSCRFATFTQGRHGWESVHSVRNREICGC